ncbi:MAG: AraC family transcriptional regulator [Nostoc sp.]|uniref:AraC family transcriptional regulator n=2 Tax=Nostoc sp. TaxID=1180 RepID=UPI002FF74800
MTDLQSDLGKIIHLLCREDGLHESPLSGTYCRKFSQTDRYTKRHWHACFAIVAQGCKEIILDREVYRCDGGHYTATPVDLPVTSRIFSATPEKPFLALLIDFDPLTLSEVAAQIEKDFPKEIENPLRAVFVGKASDKMLEAAIRLGKLFQVPEDAPVLGPLVVKEILYHLLKGADGPALWQFVRSGSKTHKISQAIYRLRSELTDDVDVAALAKAAKMSRSAFFKHFKEVTSMSPIQYQKRLRLLEARHLMTDEGETAESSAFKVGYNSASQFSREYSRMFGNSPLRDAMKIKKTGHPIHQI